MVQEMSNMFFTKDYKPKYPSLYVCDLVKYFKWDLCPIFINPSNNPIFKAKNIYDIFFSSQAYIHRGRIINTSTNRVEYGYPMNHFIAITTPFTVADIV